MTVAAIGFFKPNELYWKFWMDVTVLNNANFISSYLSISKIKDFYLADINGKKVKALLNEEYSFDFFVSEYKD